MGFQYILSSHTAKKRDMGQRVDESGQLSLDFLVGFSIFMLTLIIASTMLSGILVGLQSKKIDYDAVAYRTGVILVEDPGEPNEKPYMVLINETAQWELIGFVQRDKVLRFGMSQFKSTPKILAPQKIECFFDRTLYPDLSDYRKRIIFGDYPYNFNITLKVLPAGTVWYVGDPYPIGAPYGYIRRIVQVKNPSSSTVDMYHFEHDAGDGRFDVNINYSELINANLGPNYWVSSLEKVSFNLTNVSGIKTAGIDNVQLNSVRIGWFHPTYGYTFYSITQTPDFINSGSINTSISLPKPVPSYILMEFPPGFFNRKSPTGDAITSWKIRFQFNTTTANVTGSTPYQGELPPAIDYHPPLLQPAVLEVRIW